MALTVATETRLAWCVIEKAALIAAREVAGIVDVETVHARHSDGSSSSMTWMGGPPFSLRLYVTSRSEAAPDALRSAVSDHVRSTLLQAVGAAPALVDVVFLGLPHPNRSTCQPPASGA